MCSNAAAGDRRRLRFDGFRVCCQGFVAMLCEPSKTCRRLSMTGVENPSKTAPRPAIRRFLQNQVSKPVPALDTADAT